MVSWVDVYRFITISSPNHHQIATKPEPKLSCALPVDRVLYRDCQNTSGVQRRNSGIDRIVELVRENPQITQAQMAEACGVSRATIAKWLARSNVIVRVGGDFGGRWEEAKVS